MGFLANAKPYTADRIAPDSVGYVGAAHTVTDLDDIVISRVLPKPTSAFSGVARTNVKLTRTIALTGALTAKGNAIVQISMSVPVGFAAADINAMLLDLGTFMATTGFRVIPEYQTINF